MTTSDRWQRIEQIFHEAIRRSTEERAAFLAETCGADEALRAEVEALIEADEHPTRLEPTPQQLNELLEAAREGVAIGRGTRLGVYLIEERLAVGGMGTVYRATRSDDQYRQTVAIKVIREDSVRPETLLRFRQERDVLARLTHPHIARLIDAGVFNGDRPYLVMEYIDGLPLDAYCHTNGLDLRERLRLFQSVCAAVQYAHRNLVVHRDLKPSNILVDEHGIPKLLDFGIAKIFAPQGDTTESAGFTRTGARLMTPDYASPEQVRGEPITTATDLYSLGVVLYELLTGQKPYGESSSAHEVERAICEEDPLRPSLAVSRRGGSDSEVPTARISETTRSTSGREDRTTRPPLPMKRLRQALAGDLDTIVLRALCKEPERRYASAEQLSEDIGRHLAGRPVLAQRDSWRYRTAKFLRRHRTAAVAALLVLITGAFGIVGVVESARTVERQLSEIRLLSDLSRLADLESAADRLWPAVPEKTSALEDWLEEASQVAERLPRHRAALEEFRASALPYDAEARQLDHETHPRLEELEALRLRRRSAEIRLARGDPDEDFLRDLTVQLDQSIAEIEPLLDERRTWCFSSVEAQWQHDKLAELVAGLARFTEPERGLLDDVSRRLELAQTIERRTITEHAERWQEAIDSIADPEVCPRYEGLDIRPQIGLIPLGPDPESGLWEFFHDPTGAPPERGAGGSWQIAEDTGLVFVLIPGGPFQMGARPPRIGESLDDPNIDPMAQPHEAPVHEVHLDPFFLSKYEMTQAQWIRATGENPSFQQAPQRHGGILLDLSHPVELVSWSKSRETLRTLGLVLPTEAQWEYAARAGTTTPWWTGRDPNVLDQIANLADRTSEGVGAPWRTTPAAPNLSDGHVVHAPVGSFRPNPFGLHDILGNVWEWCLDDYGYYPIPVLPGTGERMLRGTGVHVGRGGSFTDPPPTIRVSHRGFTEHEVREKNIGLRPARALDR